MKKILISLMPILVVAVLCIGFVSCGGSDDKEEQQEQPSALIVGCWETSHYGGKYDTYAFFDDGNGMYIKWEETPNSSVSNASSNYTTVFTYSLSGETLVLDFGLGYTKRFRVQSISQDYLDMYFNTTNILCTRRDVNQRNIFPDYLMAIIGEWDINDTEKSKSYNIIFRADGSYQSISSGITEIGTYQVDKSRVTFSSSTSGSLLNGRVFLITHCSNNTWGGSINLETENGNMISGTLKK